MRTATFRAEVHEQLERIGQADIIVGIPSFNNARTIGHVVRAVQAGLAKYFPDYKAVIVNSDGGSSDGTMDVVRNTSIDDFNAILLHHRVEPAAKIAFPYSGIPGKGSAFRTVFEIAEILGAKACAVVDSDLRSITPEWIELLVKPVLSGGYDYVSPLYHRHKFDGTITNSIVYPLTRALYGKRMRQPIGGDFGFSGEVAKFYLTKECVANRCRALRHRHLDDYNGDRERLQGHPVVSRCQDSRRQGSRHRSEQYALSGGQLNLRTHGDLCRRVAADTRFRAGTGLRF